MAVSWFKGVAAFLAIGGIWRPGRSAAKRERKEPILERPPVPWRRWTDGEMKAALLHLGAVQKGDHTTDDQLLTAELLIHRYLPDGVIQTEADYHTVKARIRRKIEEAPPAAAPPPEPPSENAVAARYARESPLLHEEDIPHEDRARVQEFIAQALLNNRGVGAIASRLFDRFGKLNLDWEMVAMDEMGECLNQARIEIAGPGATAIWMAPFTRCCPACDDLERRGFEIVACDDLGRDVKRHVWVGKRWIDRPKGATWPGAGIQGYRCRGVWNIKPKRPANVSPEFADRLSARIESVMRVRERPRYYSDPAYAELPDDDDED